MGIRGLLLVILLLLLLLFGLSAVAGPPPALAAPHSGPTAVVTLGDSYISGEAGRWLGNSGSIGSANGTDRACPTVFSFCDPSRVYIDGTAKNGCHRSDVSEARSARLPVANRINIACSGALTRNVLRAIAGGVAQNPTERQQDDQLAAIAATHAVRMIVLSIGGNDLNFATLAYNCFLAYNTRDAPPFPGPCATYSQAALEAKATQDRVIRDIRRVIADIRHVMAAAGYSPSSYRLVEQTYPSVLPPASRARAGYASQGCPFYAQDLTWAHDQAVPTIAGVVRTAILAEPGVELLDLQGLLNGHEACAQTDAQADLFTSAPSPAKSEWGRYISYPDASFESYRQEFLHPNAYAQMALGRCLTQLYSATRTRRYVCTGAAEEIPGQVRLTVNP
ncbi:MAG: hypothetical protein QOH12_2133 [Solirubrobacteraceae bacterium]|jgi:hypothetical protein|nr:hypothetical protein [Solirubrobacteraceae bacterium]